MDQFNTKEKTNNNQNEEGELHELQMELEEIKSKYEKMRQRFIKLEENNLEQKQMINNIREDYNREVKYSKQLKNEIEMLTKKANDQEEEEKKKLMTSQAIGFSKVEMLPFGQESMMRPTHGMSRYSAVKNERESVFNMRSTSRNTLIKSKLYLIQFRIAG